MVCFTPSFLLFLYLPHTCSLLAYTRMEGARCAEHCGVQAKV